MEKRTFNKNTSINEVGYPCSDLGKARKHGGIKPDPDRLCLFFYNRKFTGYLYLMKAMSKTM
jgi:hypothetical protein